MPDYDVYQPDGDDEGPEGAENWCVVVEVANGRQDHPPTRVIVAAEDFADRRDAVEEARRQAFEFRPPDPAFPQLRQVFEDDDGFLSIVQGAVSTFHFRTRVMRLAGVAER